MDNEIQLISDDDGLMVIGNVADVDRFLVSEGLSSSKDLGPQWLVKRNEELRREGLKTHRAALRQRQRKVKRTERIVLAREKAARLFAGLDEQLIV